MEVAFFSAMERETDAFLTRLRQVRQQRLEFLLGMMTNMQSPNGLIATLAIGEVIPRPRLHVRRQIWMKSRNSTWWDDMVTSGDSEQWKSAFRMQKSTFMVLCEKLIPHLPKQMGPYVRKPIPTEKKIAIALYKLASCCEYRVVGDVFGIHKSSVHNCLYQFLDAILKLMKEFIFMPTCEESQEIARRIEAKYGFPQVMGAIDGTHIPILPPLEGKRDYINRKCWASYILQAVVDDRFCFRDISCKVPGSAHDAAALGESNLKRNETRLPQAPCEIDGHMIPMMILGDSAYPLLPWLMKGYVGANLTPEEESFNVYLSSARVMIEIAFGRLKSRWRMLCKRSDVHYSVVPKVVAACCILHNFCEMEKEVVNQQWTKEVEELERMYPQPTCQTCRSVVNHSDDIQEVLKTYLARNFILRKSSYMRIDNV